jgi:hypothetical protein
MSYNPLVPTGSVPLNVDYQNLQNNFQQLDTSFGVNHVLFSEATNNGKHTIVSLLNQLAHPADDTTSGTIYSLPGYAPSGGDHQLYYKSPDTIGNGEQITGSRANINGFGYFSGILCLWGIVTPPPSQSGTVTFATSNLTSFQTSCFAVITQIVDTGPASNQTSVSAVTKLKFNYKGGTTFYWVAIGV